MAGKIYPWLEELVVSEITGALTWKRNASRQSGIKPDPEDTRFSDDGSNLRSVVISPPLHSDCRVQLIQVLKETEPTTVLFSDGISLIQARLSKEAVITFQDEIDDQLTTDLKGDILQITNMTVVATPFGPSEKFVQLHIHQLQYVTTQRKKIGAPIPVDKHARIQELISQILALRTTASFYHENERENDTVSQQEMPSSPPPFPSQVGSPVQRIGNGSGPASPSPNALRTLPLRSPTVAESQTQRFQTQYVRQASPASPINPRKRSALLMDQDGLEIESGVNLSVPQAPGFRPLNDNTTRRQPNRSSLLNLFNRGIAVEVDSPHPPPNDSKTSNAMDVDLPDHKVTPVEEQQTGEPMRTVDDALGLDDNSALNNDQPTNNLVFPNRQTRSNRRRQYIIPANQKALLEKKTSWIPSLPGQTFPHPNVPIEILNAWNAATTFPAKPSASRNPSSTARSVANSINSRERLSEGYERQYITSTPESSSSDADEELGSSQWPPTSPPRDNLPPDSSGMVQATQLPLDSSPRPSSSASLEMSVPRHLNPREEHRRRHREFMQREQRRACACRGEWLCKTLHCLSHNVVNRRARLICGDCRLRSNCTHTPQTGIETWKMFRAYRSSCPDDQIDMEEFGSDLRNEFPVEPTTREHAHEQRRQDTMVGTQQIHERPNPKPIIPSSELKAMMRIPSSPPARRNSKGAQVSSSVTSRALPWKPTTAQSTPASSERVIPSAKSSSQEVSVRQQKSPPSIRKHSEQDSVSETPAESSTEFARFACAWSNIKPRGAFARKPQQTPGRSLDVLSWRFG